MLDLTFGHVFFCLGGWSDLGSLDYTNLIRPHKTLDRYTPENNMEPKSPPIKENHLNQTSIFGVPAGSTFQGVSPQPLIKVGEMMMFQVG